MFSFNAPINRSCGQIFCADCSEFWAPLPDIKLFSPARLCGPCYHSVTTRMQQVNNQLQNSTIMHLQQSATKPAATSKAWNDDMNLEAGAAEITTALAATTTSSSILLLNTKTT